MTTLPRMPVQTHTVWTLQDAKAQFSEVVRRARTEGPQHVTVRGRDAVVVVAAEEISHLLGSNANTPFLNFMESLTTDGLLLDRDPDTGRTVAL